MSEAIHAREKSGSHERCPFCHEEFSANAPGDATAERVTCASCGTPHHAECFSENGGCSSMSCDKAVARIASGAEVPAQFLDEARRPPREYMSLALIVGGLLFVAFGAFLPTGAAQIILVLGGLMVLIGSGVRALGRAAMLLPLDELRDLPPNPDRRAPFQFPPRSWEPQHDARVLDATTAPLPNEEAPAPTAPTGPTVTCPSCRRALEAGTDLAFCYHCGAAVS